MNQGQSSGHRRADHLADIAAELADFSHQGAGSNQSAEGWLNMALLITDECINCDVCEPECPNQAIYMGKDI